MTAPSPPTMPRPPAAEPAHRAGGAGDLACTSTSGSVPSPGARRLPGGGRQPVRASGRCIRHTDIPKLVAELVSKVSDEQVYADLDASLAWAARNGGDPARVAVTGFWGGRLTWMCRAQPGREGRRGLVRQAQRRPRPHQRYALDVAQDLRARSCLRPRRQHSAGRRRQDEGQPGRRQRAARRSEIVVYPRPTTASWPTIVPTTTPRPTAGAACWTGSRTTSNRPLARTPITGPRGRRSQRRP